VLAQTDLFIVSATVHTPLVLQCAIGTYLLVIRLAVTACLRTSYHGVEMRGPRLAARECLSLRGGEVYPLCVNKENRNRDLLGRKPGFI
jgi:hypothetical protein